MDQAMMLGFSPGSSAGNIPPLVGFAASDKWRLPVGLTLNNIAGSNLKCNA